MPKYNFVLLRKKSNLFAKSQKQIDISRKRMYNLRKEQCTNCKAIGDDCSEEL